MCSAWSKMLQLYSYSYSYSSYMPCISLSATYKLVRNQHYTYSCIAIVGGVSRDIRAPRRARACLYSQLSSLVLLYILYTQAIDTRCSLSDICWHTAVFIIFVSIVRDMQNKGSAVLSRSCFILIAGTLAAFGFVNVAAQGKITSVPYLYS